MQYIGGTIELVGAEDFSGQCEDSFVRGHWVIRSFHKWGIELVGAEEDVRNLNG